MIAAVIAAAPFGAVGLLFALIGALIERSSRRFARIAERATGTIVKLSFSRRASFGTVTSTGGSLYPTVRFTTADGREVTAQSHVGSNPPPGKVGDTVGVLYDPRNPERVRVDTRTGRGCCLGVAFLLIGAALIAAAIVILVATA